MSAISENSNLNPVEKKNNVQQILRSLNDLSRNILLNNSTKVLKSSLFGIQISNLSDSKEVSISNNLSFVDLSDCEKKLKSHYNIPDNLSLLIIKSDLSSIASSKLSPLVNIKIFSPIGKREELNTSLCNDTKYTISFPIDKSSLKVFDYFLLNHINISDPYDPFFTNRCLNFDSLIKNITNSDNYYSLNQRIKLFYQKSTQVCITGKGKCTVLSSNDSSYKSCSCLMSSNNNAFFSSSPSLLSSIPVPNYDIIFCFLRFSQNSVGFILLLPIIIIIYGLSIKYYLKRHHLIESRLDNITRVDLSLCMKMDIIRGKYMQSSQNQFTTSKVSSLSDKKLQQISVIQNLMNIKDYFKLSGIALFLYDKRNFKSYLKDLLTLKNSIYFTFFNNSIKQPKFLLLMKTLNEILLIFFTNCLLFQDSELAEMESKEMFEVNIP